MRFSFSDESAQLTFDHPDASSVASAMLAIGEAIDAIQDGEEAMGAKRRVLRTLLLGLGALLQGQREAIATVQQDLRQGFPTCPRNGCLRHSTLTRGRRHKKGSSN